MTCFMFITRCTKLNLTLTLEFSPNIGAAWLLETIKSIFIFLPRWLILTSHSTIIGILLEFYAVSFRFVLCLNLF